MKWPGWGRKIYFIVYLNVLQRQTIEYSLCVQFHPFLLSQEMFKEIYRALWKSAFLISSTEKRLYWGRSKWQYRTWDMREFIMAELTEVEDTLGGGPQWIICPSFCLLPIPLTLSLYQWQFQTSQILSSGTELLCFFFFSFPFFIEATLVRSKYQASQWR